MGGWLISELLLLRWHLGLIGDDRVLDRGHRLQMLLLLLLLHGYSHLLHGLLDGVEGLRLLLLVSLELELVEELVEVVDLVVGQVAQVLALKLVLDPHALPIDVEKHGQLHEGDHVAPRAPDRLRSVPPVSTHAVDCHGQPDEDVGHCDGLVQRDPVLEV